MPELRETEKRLQTIFDHVDEAILLLDAAGIIQQCNKVAEALFAYDAGKLSGQPLSLLLANIDSSELKGFLIELASKKKGAQAIDVLGIDSTGEDIPFELTINPAEIDGDDAFVAVFYDSRERNHQRATLLQIQKLESISQLTGGVAHDFNNLLATIIGNLELLNLAITDTKQRENVNAAYRAATKGSNLTRQLLAFSKKQDIEVKLLSVNESIANIAEMIKVSVGSIVDLELDLTEKDYTILADSASLENAVLNLCMNARDAMANGGKLRISTTFKSIDEKLAAKLKLATGDYISICVQDDGSGMSKHVRQRALEPFFTTKEFGSGSGLGLSMVYGTVEQLGGAIYIDSEEGKGTTVELVLPYVGQESTASELAQSESENASRSFESVLIIDDNIDVLEMTAKVFGRLDYKVHTAANGDQALDVVNNEESLDLVLCDIVLDNGEKGSDVVKHIKTLRDDLSFLFMSGYSSLPGVDFDEIAKIGLLSKPFSIQELRDRLTVMEQNRTRAC